MMKKYYKNVEKQTDNPYLNLYRIEAVDSEEKEFGYYFASRRKEDNLRMQTQDDTPEGVLIYAVTEEASPRLVVIREYRYPIGDYIYALPAGLIDDGETAGEAAKRELLEETGYHFAEYTEGDACFRRPFYIAPGICDEANPTVFGTVKDMTEGQQCETQERIEVILADKDMVRNILRKEKVSMRGAYLMMLFLSTRDNAFDFIE